MLMASFSSQFPMYYYLTMPPIKLSGFGSNVAAFLEMESLELDPTGNSVLAARLREMFDCLVDNDSNGTLRASHGGLSLLGNCVSMRNCSKLFNSWSFRFRHSNAAAASVDFQYQG